MSEDVLPQPEENRLEKALQREFKTGSSAYRRRLLISFPTSITLNLLAAIALTYISASHPAQNNSEGSGRGHEVIYVESGQGQGTEQKGKNNNAEYGKRQGAAFQSELDAIIYRIENYGLDGQILNLEGHKFNLEKIRAQRDIFPFITHSFSFRTGKAPTGEYAGKESSVRIFYDASVGDSVKLPLEISNEGLQEIIDKIWSRKSRWDDFANARDYIEKYNPNLGRLPDLLRGYVDQNIPQLYSDFFYLTTGNLEFVDSRLWATLEIASEHKSFIQLATNYINQNPSTKTSTEFLFLLDKLAEGSFNTLRTLYASNPEKSLNGTRFASHEAHELVVSVYRHYKSLFEGRHLNSIEEIKREYGEVRLHFLDTIVQTSPNVYRVNDAYFLMGKVYWEQGRTDEALAAWGRINPNKTDTYREAYAGILGEIKKQKDKPNPKAIDEILKAEFKRFLQFSDQRLRHFGYDFYKF